MMEHTVTIKMTATVPELGGGSSLFI